MPPAPSAQARCISATTISPVSYTHLDVYKRQIQAMRAKPAYLGCLGSRRKTAFVRARLEQEGFTQDQIDELHLPIGVAIEAEDPERCV